METARWSDVFTPDELAAALDLHAAKIARKAGWYEVATDLHHAAECIRDLTERLGTCAGKAEELQGLIAQMQTKARAALESFSKLPQ